MLRSYASFIKTYKHLVKLCAQTVFIQMHLPAIDMVIKLTQIFLIVQVNCISHVAKQHLMSMDLTQFLPELSCKVGCHWRRTLFITVLETQRLMSVKEKAWQVKSLLHKHEALSLDPQLLHKRLGVLSLSSSCSQEDPRTSLASRSKPMSFKFSNRPYLRKWGRQSWRKRPKASLWCQCAHSQAPHTCVNPAGRWGVSADSQNWVLCLPLLTSTCPEAAQF